MHLVQVLFHFVHAAVALLHHCHRFAEIRVLSGVRREWSAEAASIQRFAQVEEGLERRTDRAECAFRVGGGLLAVLGSRSRWRAGAKRYEAASLLGRLSAVLGVLRAFPWYLRAGCFLGCLRSVYDVSCSG